MGSTKKAPAYIISADQFEAAYALAGFQGGWTAQRSACFAYLVLSMPIEVAAKAHNLQPCVVRDALLRIDIVLQFAAVACGGGASVQVRPHPNPDTGRANMANVWDMVRAGYSVDNTVNNE